MDNIGIAEGFFASLKAASPYLAIAAGIGLFANLEQSNDLARREIRGHRGVILGVLLVAIQFLDARWLDRDLSAALGGKEAIHWRLAMQVVLAVAFLVGHITGTQKLFHDKVKLDPRGPIVRWTWIYAGAIVLTAIVASLPLVAPSSPAAEVARFASSPFDKRTVFLLVVLYALGAWFCAKESLLRWLAGRLRSWNLIAIHSLALIVLTATAALRSWANEVKLPIFTLALVGAMVVGTIVYRGSKADADPGRQVDSAPWPQSDGAPDVRIHEVDGRPTMMLFVSDGGGIHAVHRTATVLSELDVRSKGLFWDRLYATSTVSGGSVGAAAYRALREDPLRPGDHERLRREAHIVGRSDLLLPSVLRILFTEPLMFLFPKAKDLDRSKGLEIALSLAVETALGASKGKRPATQEPMDLVPPEKKRSAVDAQLKDLKAGTESPHHFFNTTSVKTGERFVVSTRCVETSRTSLDGGPFTPHSVTLRAAAALSARFPVVSSSGMVPVGAAGEGLFERVIDGGLYDNTGLDVAIKLVREVKKKHPGLRTRIVLVSNNLEKLRDNPILNHTESKTETFRRTGWFEGTLTLLYVAAASLLDRNDDNTRELNRLLGIKEEDIDVASFIWDKEAINAPLGWFIDGSRARIMDYMLGCDKTYYVESPERLYPAGLKATEFDDAFFAREFDGRTETLDALDALRAHNLEAIDKVMGWLDLPQADA